LKIQKTNPMIIELIESLRRLAYENKARIWKDLSKRLSRGTRRIPAVNVGSISSHTSPNDQVVVPGKVLGMGQIDHPVTVASLSFSEKAREKITKAGGECIGLLELVQRNPRGSKVKIIS